MSEIERDRDEPTFAPVNPLRFLAAVAEHERQQADVIALGVDGAQEKVGRAKEAYDAAKAAVPAAKADATEAEKRAVAAEAAFLEAAKSATPAELAEAGVPRERVDALADTAHGTGGV